MSPAISHNGPGNHPHVRALAPASTPDDASDEPHDTDREGDDEGGVEDVAHEHHAQELPLGSMYARQNHESCTAKKEKSRLAHAAA